MKNNSFGFWLFGFLGVAAIVSSAATVVDITGVGAEKRAVSIDVRGANAAAYAKTLKRNLELSGCFVVTSGGGIKVAGTVGGEVRAADAAKSVASSAAVTDEKSARMAARAMSDAMCQGFADQKGFAQDKVVFVSRKGPDNSELCMCYPDGQDIRQLTTDGKSSVGPRWKDDTSLFYTGFLQGGPQIWEHNTATGKRSLRWSFKGLATGAVVSPDATKAAIILSFQGNPELYVIDLATSRWQRMTTTPNASEGQPSWSPDGKKLVFVSDETRQPQLYVIDTATKAKRRLTSRGSQNVDPDWGRDGRIAYITKRGGLSQVAVLDPSEDDGAATLVTTPGSWEHPSWSRDMRHVVAGRDKALFVVDTLPDGDKPVQMFFSNGNWITPSWNHR